MICRDPTVTTVHTVKSKCKISQNCVAFSDYRISSYGFRGNNSFLNLTLCTVTFGNSTYRCGNSSREETLQGRKLFAEIQYIKISTVCKCLHIKL